MSVMFALNLSATCPPVPPKKNGPPGVSGRILRQNRHILRQTSRRQNSGLRPPGLPLGPQGKPKARIVAQPARPVADAASATRGLRDAEPAATAQHARRIIIIIIMDRG
jgi:hypothetical protein